MSATNSFDASARHASDSRSREFADHWFLSDGKDLTDIDGISFGHLLRLPVFLSKQDDDKQTGSWGTLLRAMISCTEACVRLWGSREAESPQPPGREYVFLMAKSVPHGAIAKHLQPVMEALHTRGETITIWTFDEAARVALHAQYPSWRCENIGQAHLNLSEIIRLASMLWRTSVPLLVSPQRADILLSLSTLFFHAPRFLALNARLRTRLHQKQVIVSATEMHPMERCVFTRANMRQIPTILIQHGVTNETVKNLVVNTPSIASRLCVWGEAAKRYFLAHKVQPERIWVTGSPALSSINPTLALSPEEIRSRFSLPEGGFILFSGQHFDREKNSALARMMLEAFIQHQAKHPTTKLVITPHPAKSPYTTPGFYQALLAQVGLKENEHVFIRSAKETVYDLIQVSEVLVTSSSTLHVEATRLKTPVILLNIDGIQDMEMVTQGAGLGAHTISELVDTLEASTQTSVLNQLAAQAESFLKDYMNLPSDPVHLVTSTLEEIGTSL
ncbi:MAG: UDP-N-acetylglucosamine 2-epimerase [Patescibacteria group bacterium]